MISVGGSGASSAAHWIFAGPAAMDSMPGESEEFETSQPIEIPRIAHVDHEPQVVGPFQNCFGLH